jgi:hypothetical protein
VLAVGDDQRRYGGEVVRVGRVAQAEQDRDEQDDADAAHQRSLAAATAAWP